MQDYLRSQQQPVVLNGRTSSWENVLPGVPQGSVLGSLLFLIYINDIPEGTKSIYQIFADDTSLFSIVKKDELSQNNLNSDLKKVSEWGHQWKVIFNYDPRKQRTEVHFSRRLNQDSPLPLDFNDNTVQTIEVHEHVGLSLDKKLDFNIHIDNKINKCNKIIGIMKRLSLSISRDSLPTIYKMFACPHLDYADIIYHKPCNVNFESKLKRVQYNACFTITGAIQGTNRDSIYAELGLESLSARRLYRKLLFFYKIVRGISPAYQTAYINFVSERNHNTRSLSQRHLEETFCST